MSRLDWTSVSVIVGKAADVVWAIADAIRAVAYALEWIADRVNGLGHALLGGYAFLVERIPQTLRLWRSLGRLVAGPILGIVLAAVRAHRLIWRRGA